ncbi:2,6-dihydropseudooxynicotine hydrolase [Cytospora mali]|uniref:2,6-dihydropseudooxynicotine hydrolase n=1 Tax=Cytospora mali TaxID=578113 RepID=A0A194VBE7_CYTMA|nr:2,6-dihydropseudooxynicotine hydrolase [Valsa mali var. pyri (nom. inval.)]
MYKFFPSDFLNFEFLRVLGTAPTLGCDVGECLEAAAKIKNDDAESWYTAWTEAAEKSEDLGEQAISIGDKETARWAFMRSKDTRLLKAISKSVDDFKKACALLDSPVECLEIPYEGFRLPAYLFLPKRGTECSGRKTPIIINTGGYDSIQEELYHFTAAGARERGYATLTFEGPGQGIVLRREKLHMRPDWEVVISAVLDQLFILSQQNPGWNLDLTRIAIVGNSMGAYFALRGALDTRIKACVCSDGLYDFGKAGRERTPFFMKDLPKNFAESLLRFVLSFDFRTRWELAHAAMVLGTGSLSEAFDRIQEFTLGPQGRERPVPEDITCPVLVTNARDSIYRLEVTRIYDSLTQHKDGHTKVLWDPIGVGQGSTQAKVAALSHLHATVFEWLDRVLEVKRIPCD